jgi:outer membrane receptor protein involved in Fe transport
MDVSTQRLPRTRATELGISLLSALANTRGYSDDESLWWLGSVRRGDLKFLTDRINSRTGNPKYWDAFGTIGHRLSTSSDLVVGTLLSRDDVEFSDKNEVATSNIDNRYLWLRLDTRYSPSVRSTTVASLTDSQGRKNLISPTPAEDSSGYLDFDRHTQKFALQTDWSVQRNAMLIEFGAELEYGEADYRSQAFIDRGQVGVLLGRPRTETIDIDRHVDGPSLGLYAAVDLQLNDRISIQPGVRFDTHDYYPQGDTHHVSPRLGLEWLLSDHLTARFALGRFYQPEAIHEMQVTDGVARFFSPQRADHYIAALEWNPAPRLSMHTEAYYKDYGNPKTRFENVFNPFVILPELEPDRVAIAPSSARVRGFDFEARYEFQSAVTATVRFSHLDAEDRINATWVPRRWSQHNTAHVITAWSNDRTELAAALTWHSGWFTAKPPAFSPGPLALEDVLNQAELDQYVSLDLRLARKWRVWRSEVTLYADLANVLDRDNQAGIDFDVVAVPGGFTFEPDAETLLPFIPTVGLLIRF